MTAISHEHHGSVRESRCSGRVRNHDARLTLCVERPQPGLIVLKASGMLDSVSFSHFSEVLRSRLGSTARVIVLDLTAVTFLGVDAIMVLSRAQRHAGATGKQLSLLTGVRAVDRPLEVLGLAGQFAYGGCPAVGPDDVAFDPGESERTIVEVPDRVRPAPRSLRGKPDSFGPAPNPVRKPPGDHVVRS
ncbi:STAS domain-containing protein [Haloactinomyces albus]|uniref:Anti-anti-sigma factor n=1 Tax=Haloactinomyces albus TaxID=1352928 RepID=A0AAE3ZCW9_9ACTN|nr:STAS domain-containing protein [Haloactinomyces albus]MDR7301343.1 anti-anti-sigma factor [Haloactinomyces albus]